MASPTEAPAAPMEVITEEPNGPVNPVPMSFPAFLRNPKLSDRYAYLQDVSRSTRSGDCDAEPLRKKRTRDERDGKRWIRRMDNAKFVGNAHIIAPGLQDMQVQAATTRSTFPEPLPSYLPRSVPAPNATLPAHDPKSADAGHFSMSLKGMRRMLRGHGPRAQQIVQDVEKEISSWLAGGTVVVLPDEPDDVFIVHGRPIGKTLTVSELSRTPLQLIWSIEQDAFARYIVHCCCRYYNVVSFSKDVDGRRLTYLLRPNVSRQDYATRNNLDTPPATETDGSLSVLSESDILSEMSDSQSEADLSRRATRHRRLSSVSERDSNADSSEEGEADAPDTIDEATPRPLRTRSAPAGSDVDNLADDSGDDLSVNGDLAQSVDSLDLSTAKGPPIRYSSPLTERTPLRDRRALSRATSSPSRSPCPPTRRPLRGARKRAAARRTTQGKPKSFYHFLYG